MTANELEVELHKLAGRLDAELHKLAGKGEADVQRLTAEDRLLNGRMDATDKRSETSEAAARETDQKLEALRVEFAAFREIVLELKSHRERWGTRAWQLATATIVALVSSVLTLVVTVLLALVGIKK